MLNLRTGLERVVPLRYDETHLNSDEAEAVYNGSYGYDFRISEVTFTPGQADAERGTADSGTLEIHRLRKDRVESRSTHNPHIFPNAKAIADAMRLSAKLARARHIEYLAAQIRDVAVFTVCAVGLVALASTIDQDPQEHTLPLRPAVEHFAPSGAPLDNVVDVIDN